MSSIKKRKGGSQNQNLSVDSPNKKRKQFKDEKISPQWDITLCGENGCECESYTMMQENECVCGHKNISHRLELQYPSGGVVQILIKILEIVKKSRVCCLENHVNWISNTLEMLNIEVNKLYKGVQGKKVSQHLTTLANSFVKADIRASLEKTIEYSDSILPPDVIIESIFILDNIYYQIYNYKNISDIGNKLDVLNPVEYFRSHLHIIEKTISALEEDVWNLKTSDMSSYYKEMIRYNDDSHNIELLKLYNIKFKETLALVYQNQDYFKNALADSIKKLKLKQKTKAKNKNKNKNKKKPATINEPICDPVLQKWRDICRDWPSLIYSYAIPTPEALQLMKKYAPLIEIGAGTGYWIHLLKNIGVDIIGYDSTPVSKTGEQNEFHANSKAFVDVIKGSSEQLSKSKRTLFLCFPPPESNMALDCLKSHKGDTFIHVGEWFGFTGTLEFAKEISKNWVLEEHMDLPNWADTNYNLTVWKRKKEDQDSPLLTCTFCSKPLPGCTLRQCKCCRNVRYCTKECMISDKNHHDDIHRLSMIFCDDITASLDFSNPLHYRPLRLQ